MKKLLIIPALVLPMLSFAQWAGTNPNPITTPQFVGIGNPGTTPSALTIFAASNTTAQQQIRLGASTTADYTIGRNPTTGWLDFIGSQNGYSGYNFTSNALNSGLHVTNTNGSATALKLFNPASGARNWAIFSTGPSNGQGAGNFSVFDYTSGLDRFFIQGSTGNVGIGTLSPTALLTVNGSVVIGNPSQVSVPTGYKLYVQTGILTEKVKVALTTTSDWADYVFAPDYKLRSLEEVEKFVNANKHLPGLPSAEALVAEGGFDVAKMDAKLLEKIEELTLYVVKLNEENKKLSARLATLESK
jgi:hypothetical protein